MSTNSEYKINKVAISGNGINELYLDVEWEGNENIDFYELRVLDRNEEYVESCAYVAHNHRMVIKDYLLGLKHKELRSETFYVELGIPEYNNEGKELSWKVLASYEPIFVNIYYEQHIFRKNVLEIRGPKNESFERSEVRATIHGHIDSVKNPICGFVTADTIGEIILEDGVVIPGECKITVKK